MVWKLFSIICNILESGFKTLTISLFAGAKMLIIRLPNVAHASRSDPRCGTPRNNIPVVQHSIWLRCFSALFLEYVSACSVTSPPRLWATKIIFLDSVSLCSRLRTSLPTKFSAWLDNRLLDAGPRVHMLTTSASYPKLRIRDSGMSCSKSLLGQCTPVSLSSQVLYALPVSP